MFAHTPPPDKRIEAYDTFSCLPFSCPNLRQHEFGAGNYRLVVHCCLIAPDTNFGLLSDIATPSIRPTAAVISHGPLQSSEDMPIFLRSEFRWNHGTQLARRQGVEEKLSVWQPAKRMSHQFRLRLSPVGRELGRIFNQLL